METEGLIEFNLFTLSELRAMVKRRKLLPGGRTSKQQLVDILENDERTNAEQTQPEKDVGSMDVNMESSAELAHDVDVEEHDHGMEARGSRYEYLRSSELQILVRRRNIKVSNHRKGRMMWALEQSDINKPNSSIRYDPEGEDNRRLRAKATRRHEEMLASWKARVTEMWASTSYQYDSSRLSFLDLPRELRDMVYKEAVFCDPEGIRDTDIWTAHYNPGFQDGGITWSARSDDVRKKRTRSTTGMLGAMNKKIRHEVYETLVEHRRQKIVGLMIGRESNEHWRANLSYSRTWYQALELLAPVGRRNLRYMFIRHRDHLDLSLGGNVSVRSLGRHLAECQNLTIIHIELYIGSIFAGSRRDIEAYFRGEGLSGAALDAFGGILKSLPNLEKAQIEPAKIRTNSALGYSIDVAACSHEDPYLTYAFTGIRAVMIWIEFQRYMEGLNVDRRWTQLSIKLPRWRWADEHAALTNFETWLAREKPLMKDALSEYFAVQFQRRTDGINPDRNDPLMAKARVLPGFLSEATARMIRDCAGSSSQET